MKSKIIFLAASLLLVAAVQFNFTVNKTNAESAGFSVSMYTIASAQSEDGGGSWYQQAWNFVTDLFGGNTASGTYTNSQTYTYTTTYNVSQTTTTYTINAAGDTTSTQSSVQTSQYTVTNSAGSTSSQTVSVTMPPIVIIK